MPKPTSIMDDMEDSMSIVEKIKAGPRLKDAHLYGHDSEWREEDARDREMFAPSENNGFKRGE